VAEAIRMRDTLTNLDVRELLNIAQDWPYAF
jgi:hypothetical protein